MRWLGLIKKLRGVLDELELIVAERDRASAEVRTEPTPSAPPAPSVELPMAYTIAETMRAVRISRTAIYQAIKCGELRAVKRGRRTLILAEDLRTWLRNLPSMHRPYSQSS
jgi:excisionase family DNA binding protein